MMENLLKTIREFNIERNWEQYHSPKNLAMALSVEVAEVVEHFQWLNQAQSKSLEVKKIEEGGGPQKLDNVVSSESA
jgi:NTP pyrophosphatase (non-canonical NTP hydrolase)